MHLIVLHSFIIVIKNYGELGSEIDISALAKMEPVYLFVYISYFLLPISLRSVE